MTVAFVHGSPETDAVWDPLLARLGRQDTVTLSPPGFGAPVPDRFEATWSGYRDWLVAELEALGGAVDLVGHDWGGGHVINAVLHRPDLVRSWVTDTLGAYHPAYRWHERAQVMRTPVDGELEVESMAGASEAVRTELLTSMGLPHRIAARIAPAQGPTMARCMLSLYRSAPETLLSALGDDMSALASRPGLVVIPTADDNLGTVEMRHTMAARAGADAVELPGLNHWWMLEAPDRSAQTLEAFWNDPAHFANR
jgi:pimeloyl-ACP methyl ester carboxylesterase